MLVVGKFRSFKSFIYSNWIANWNQ